jgi:hypothetical protein
MPQTRSQTYDEFVARAWRLKARLVRRGLILESATMKLVTPERVINDYNCLTMPTNTPLPKLLKFEHAGLRDHLITGRWCEICLHSCHVTCYWCREIPPYHGTVVQSRENTIRRQGCKVWNHDKEVLLPGQLPTCPLIITRTEDH